MKRMPICSVFFMIPAVVVFFSIPAACSGKEHASFQPRISIETATTKSGGGTNLLFDAVGGMLSDLQVDPEIAGEFNMLYDRNSAEINRLFVDNPELVWEAFEVVYDILPAFRNLNKEGGKLHIEKDAFSRAMLLFGEIESLASPQLEADIKRATKLVQSRMSSPGAEQVLIDLGRSAVGP